MKWVLICYEWVLMPELYHLLIYESYPYRRIELLKKLLGNLKMTVDDQVASWCLDLQTKEELSIKPEDSENLSDLIRGIDSVRVAVFFEELKDCSVRVKYAL